MFRGCAKSRRQFLDLVESHTLPSRLKIRNCRTREPPLLCEFRLREAERVTNLLHPRAEHSIAEFKIGRPWMFHFSTPLFLVGFGRT